MTLAMCGECVVRIVVSGGVFWSSSSAFAEKVAIDEPLHMRMKMGFWLFDDEECVVTLAVGDEPVEFKALQRQEDQIGGAKACIRDTPRTIVNQQAQAAEQRVDPGRSETECQRDGVLLAQQSRPDAR